MVNKDQVKPGNELQQSDSKRVRRLKKEIR